MTASHLRPGSAAAADPYAATSSHSGLADRIDPVLRQAAILHGLADDAVDAFVAELDAMHADRGAVIFRQGDPGDYLYIVLSGKVKLARGFGQGMERLVALLGPGDQFGELSLLDPGPRNSTATVVADARLARLRKDCLDRWMFERPEVALRILHVLARRLRRTNSDLADTLFIDVPGRIAKQLLVLARRFGVREADGIRVQLDLSQAELAQLVGSSRESVNKTLSDFANRGWIHIGARSVVIVDSERLAGRAR